MIKIDAYLWPRKNAEDKFPIKIRITKNRKSIYQNIDYAISKRHWNTKSHRVRESYANHKVTNETIESKIKELQHTYSVKSPIVKSEKKISFFDYFELYLVFLEKSKRFGDLKKHKVVFNNHLKTFVKNEYQKEDFLFEEIDDFFLSNLKAYFDGLGLSYNTQNGYFKKIKHLYYDAMKKHHFKPIINPFITFNNVSSQPKNKSLTIDELKSIEVFNPFQYDFKEEIKIDSNDLFNVKNTFLFQFYMRGMRVSDLIFLKWENINNGKIEYVMRKTKKQISIPINDEMLYILRLYMPFQFKLQYFAEMNYEDKEMFYSLNKEERI